MEYLKVAKLENGDFPDRYCEYIITYQDENLLKRSEYHNEELNIYSVDSPEYKTDTKAIYLRGRWKVYDDNVLFMRIEDEASFLDRISKLNAELAVDAVAKRYIALIEKNVGRLEYNE